MNYSHDKCQFDVAEQTDAILTHKHHFGSFFAFRVSIDGETTKTSLMAPVCISCNKNLSPKDIKQILECSKEVSDDVTKANNLCNTLHNDGVINDKSYTRLKRDLNHLIGSASYLEEPQEDYEPPKTQREETMIYSRYTHAPTNEKQGVEENEEEVRSPIAPGEKGALVSQKMGKVDQSNNVKKFESERVMSSSETERIEGMEKLSCGHLIPLNDLPEMKPNRLLLCLECGQMVRFIAHDICRSAFGSRLKKIN